MGSRKDKHISLEGQKQTDHIKQNTEKLYLTPMPEERSSQLITNIEFV